MAVTAIAPATIRMIVLKKKKVCIQFSSIYTANDKQGPIILDLFRKQARQYLQFIIFLRTIFSSGPTPTLLFEYKYKYKKILGHQILFKKETILFCYNFALTDVSN